MSNQGTERLGAIERAVAKAKAVDKKAGEENCQELEENANVER